MADVKDQEKTLTVPEADTEPKTASAPFGGGTEEPPKKRKKLKKKPKLVLKKPNKLWKLRKKKSSR